MADAHNHHMHFCSAYVLVKYYLLLQVQPSRGGVLLHTSRRKQIAVAQPVAELVSTF